jgi:hypothetical protein
MAGLASGLTAIAAELYHRGFTYEASVSGTIAAVLGDVSGNYIFTQLTHPEISTREKVRRVVNHSMQAMTYSYVISITLHSMTSFCRIYGGEAVVVTPIDAGSTGLVAAMVAGTVLASLT